MKIIDNLLEEKQVLEIEQELVKDTFPWFYQNCVTHKDIDNYYFTHMFYRDGEQSRYFNLIIPILKKIKFKKLIRVKGNLYPNINKVLDHPRHVDFNYTTKGALFYLNTNNGPTTVGNKKIESVRNRLLLFNASQEHNSTTCTDAKIRLNININYL
jgi:hypothetical protein|tara:strand:+ start:2689 stop:3156 length:468 start_codon:yes stop_codon:yes gene_type:complete